MATREGEENRTGDVDEDNTNIDIGLAPEDEETPELPEETDDEKPEEKDDYVPPKFPDAPRKGSTRGVIDIGPGNVPKAGEGPGAYETSGTGPDDAIEWNVDREQTVRGQLEDNYDRGSPFMEKAGEQAQRAHQASGGQNSLMAQKAGHMAAMDTAFKVSFADAAIYARSAEFNAAMKNQFGLAEQRFIQNSLLSEQNYQQSVELQTQMIAGQLEGIRQEFKGKGMLMDKEFAQFFEKAAYEAQLKEYGEQTGFERAVSLQSMISKGSFFTNGFLSVMEMANQPGFTPEQSSAAASSGMRFFREGVDIYDSFWASVMAGGGGYGDSPFGGNGSYPWADYSNENTGG